MTNQWTGPRRLVDRFMDKVDITLLGCWPWEGALTTAGYGSLMRTQGRIDYAHRISYELFEGPIPDGMTVDHLCRNRGCVNPDHLEIVTNRENVRRGIKGVLTTHCPQGHPYNEENTYTAPSRYGRRCRICARKRQRTTE